MGFVHLLRDRDTTGVWIRPGKIPDSHLDVVCTCWARLEVLKERRLVDERGANWGLTFNWGNGEVGELVNGEI